MDNKQTIVDNFTIEEVNIIDNKKEGPTTIYYKTAAGEKGSVMFRGNYKNGDFYGEFTEYYKDGIIKSTGEFNGPIRRGISKSYHKNGNLATISNYHESGCYDGEVKMYNNYGILASSYYYHMGTLKRFNEYVI